MLFGRPTFPKRLLLYWVRRYPGCFDELTFRRNLDRVLLRRERSWSNTPEKQRYLRFRLFKRRMSKDYCCPICTHRELVRDRKGYMADVKLQRGYRYVRGVKGKFKPSYNKGNGFVEI